MDDGYGIISTGFSKKTYNDLLSGLETKLRSADLFGQDIDFTDQDPLKQFSVPIIELFSEMWELGEQIFYAPSPKYAESNNLSSTGKFIGISRKQATRATGIVRFTGTAGTSIPSGYQIATDTKIYFVTTESKLIAQSGYIDVNIQAVSVGSSGNVAANTITKIVSPLIGLNSITNLNETTEGQDQESDTDFRLRYEASTANGAGSTYDAIKANVLKVTNVTDCVVTGNEEDTTVNSIPAHSFETLVKGGTDNDIAQAIFAKKPGGIKPYGTTTVNVTDTQGIAYTVGFSRPTNTNVWIKIDLTTDSNFPISEDPLIDGNSRIKTAVLNYISNLKLGEDVIIYKIITIISALQLAGLLDMVITLSTDGTTYNASNIAIDSKNVAITDINKISII